MTKDALTAAEQYINARRANSSQAALEIAEKLAEVKLSVFVGNTDKWLTWCRVKFSYSRREAFDLVRVATFVNKVVPSVRRAALPMRKLSVLAQLTSEAQYKRLRKTCDPAKVSRDELRVAVAKVLGRKASDSDASGQTHFGFYDCLPKPDKLLVGLSDPNICKDIKPDLEIEYIDAHMQRIYKVLDRLSPEEQSQLITNLHDAADTVQMLTTTGARK